MTQTLNVGSQSRLVTLTAWFFIFLAAFAVVAAVVQNAATGSQLAGHAPASALPTLTRFLMAYLPWVVGSGLALSLATLVAAVGLLMRYEWARRAFIGLLFVAIVANLAGLWLQSEVLQSVVTSTLGRTPLPQQALDLVGGFVTASRAMGAVLTLGACALLGWLVRLLMSPQVRQEFA